MQTKRLIDFIAQKLEDLKADNIVILDVKDKSDIADYMIISTGTSSKHVSSVAHYLMEEAKKANLPVVVNHEARNNVDWTIVDFHTVIVHIMQEESRLLYELEKLWG